LVGARFVDASFKVTGGRADDAVMRGATQGTIEGTGMEMSSGRRKADQARVRDYMTASPQTVDIGQSLLDVVLLMRSTGFRHIPILDEGQLAGVISDRDVGRYTPSILVPVSQQEYNRVFEETPISKVMKKHPQTIGADAPLAYAAKMMIEHKLGCLLVIDDGQLGGILTVRDMLRALGDTLASEAAPPPDAL
jgi:CBS domain-containing protein